ncbi:MAG: hypothetical protein MR446_05295, partial [Bacteroidales bacterium]|nr:hypothetical protein [Bacteroidales bacterium]
MTPRCFFKKNPSRENIFSTLENNFSTLEKIFSRLGKKFSRLENFLTRRGIFLTRHLFSTPSIPVNAGQQALIGRRQEERIIYEHHNIFTFVGNYRKHIATFAAIQPTQRRLTVMGLFIRKSSESLLREAENEGGTGLKR